MQRPGQKKVLCQIASIPSKTICLVQQGFLKGVGHASHTTQSQNIEAYIKPGHGCAKVDLRIAN